MQRFVFGKMGKFWNEKCGNNFKALMYNTKDCHVLRLILLLALKMFVRVEWHRMGGAVSCMNIRLSQIFTIPVNKFIFLISKWRENEEDDSEC